MLLVALSTLLFTFRTFCRPLLRLVPFGRLPHEGFIVLPFPVAEGASRNIQLLWGSRHAAFKEMEAFLEVLAVVIVLAVGLGRPSAVS